MYHAKILGTGSAFPEKELSNRDLEKIVDTSDEWIQERTGIVTRRKVAEGEENSDLGALASERALEMAGISAEDIGLILYCTNTPDKILPATACIMQPKIGAKNAVAFDINAACAGWVLGLSVADQFVRTGNYKHVLVVGAEALSRFVNWNDRNTCVLFGDGAGATVISRAEEGEESKIYSTKMLSDGNYESILDIRFGGSQFPVTEERLGQPGQYIAMNGREVFKFAVRALADRCREVLKENNYSVTDVDWFVPHQANIRIIEAVNKKLEAPMEKTLLNVHKYGNTSAATCPTAFDEAVRDGRVKRGDLVLFVTFGGGLTSAASLVRF